MSRNQLKRPKEFEKESTRLRRDFSDVTLDDLIPTEAARMKIVLRRTSSNWRPNMAGTATGP